MPDVSTPHTSDDWVSQIETWPVHSARRSFTNFKNHLLDQLPRLPELTVHEPGLMMHAQHVGVEPKAYFHYAATSSERFAEGMSGLWADYSRRLLIRGVKFIEVWAGQMEEAKVLGRLGFRLGDEMGWFRFEGPQPRPVDARIRDYRPEDLDTLLTIHHLTSEEEWQLSRRAYEDWLNTVDTRVLEIEGTIAGLTHFRQIAQQGLFEGLAVHPGFQRRGVARALVEDSFTWFATRGAETIDLFVLETNEAAIRLYEGMGYRRVGQQVQLSLAL